MILTGKFTLVEHSLDEPYHTSCLAVATAGDFLGVPDLDMGLSCLPYVFSVCKSSKAVAVKMQVKAYKQMWSQTRIRENEILFGVLN